MKLATLLYTKSSGWSEPTLPKLDSENTLVIVFGAPCLIDAPEPIDQIVQAYPKAHMLGCSSSGEIFGTSVFDESLSVGVIQFEHTTLATATARVKSAADSYAAGGAVALALQKPSLRGILVLSDGIHVNGSELIRELNANLPNSVVVTGGLVGDGRCFEETWTLQNGALESGMISAVGFYSYEEISPNTSGYCDLHNQTMTLTTISENKL